MLFRSSLPQVVTFGNGSTITYFYAADGTKVRTVHVVNGATTQTEEKRAPLV